MIGHNNWQMVLYGGGRDGQIGQIPPPGAICEGAMARLGASGGRAIPRSWPLITGADWIGRFISVSIALGVTLRAGRPGSVGGDAHQGMGDAADRPFAVPALSGR
jgi:hypothetical protein